MLSRAPRSSQVSGYGNHRVRRCQGGGTISGRRVDPQGVDLRLERLGLVLDQFELAIPAFGEHRAPGTQVEAGHVLRLTVRGRLDTQQIRSNVTPGVAAQGDRMLTAHCGEVAKVVGRGIGDVAGGVDMLLTQDLQVLIDVQTPLGIAIAGQLFGQWAGAAGTAILGMAVLGDATTALRIGWPV